jgi:hypothetical protein
MSSDKFGTRVVELSKRLQISIADALLIIDAEDKIKEQTHKIDQKTEMRSFSYTEESFSDLMNEKLTDEVIGKYAEELLPDLSALTDSILAAISKSDFQILPLALIRNANEILKELNKPNSKDTRRQNFMIWLKTLWLILGFNICGSGRSDLLFKDGIQLPDTKISQLFVEHIFKYVLQNRVAEPDSIEKEEFQNNLSKAAHYVSRRHTKEKSYMRTWATTEKKRTKKAKISKEEVFIRSARINKEIKNTAAKNYTQVPDKYNSQRWANEWNQQDTTGDKSHGNNNISGYNQTEWVPENEEFSQYDNNLNMEPVTKNKSNTTVTNVRFNYFAAIL